jgi:hypothetical protein
LLKFKRVWINEKHTATESFRWSSYFHQRDLHPGNPNRIPSWNFNKHKLEKIVTSSQGKEKYPAR